MQPVAVIAADIHLQPLVWTKRPDIRGDTYRSLMWLAQQAAEYQVPLILLGDIFDKARPDSESVAVFMEAAKRAKRVLFIQGNHDKADPPWPSMAPEAQHIHKKLLNIAGLNFYGLDYTPSEHLSGELANIPPEADIVLTHQAWAEIQEVGRTDGSLKDIPGSHVVLCGDYHVRKSFNVTSNTGDNLMIHSPGSTAMQALNEPVEKFGTLLVRSPASIELRDLQIPTRWKHAVQLTDEASFLDFIKPETVNRAQRDLEHLPERPILNVKYSDTIPDAYAKLTEYYAPFTHLFLQAYAPQSTTEYITQEQVDTCVTLDTALLAMPLQLAVAASASHILGATDLNATLENLKKDFLAQCV